MQGSNLPLLLSSDAFCINYFFVLFKIHTYCLPEFEKQQTPNPKM